MSDYWKDNNLIKPASIVVCAANRYGDIIIPSARHHDKIMNDIISRIGGLKPIDSEQGFINQFCEFLTREEAMNLCKKSGQIVDIDRCGSNETLYSEGLY